MNSDSTLNSSNASEFGRSEGGSVITPNESVTLSATVMRVIDGGTVVVKYRNGSRETFQLMGIDVPQTTLSKTAPRQYGYNNTADTRAFTFGIGKDAKQYANQKLNRKQVQLVVGLEKGNHEERGAYLYVNNVDLSTQLLSKGYARVANRTITKYDVYKNAETNACQQNVGIWSYGSPRNHSKTSRYHS